MEDKEIFLLLLGLGLFIKITIVDKIKAFNKKISEFPIMLLSLVTNPLFTISIIIFSSIILIFLLIRHHNARLEKKRLEMEKLEERKVEKRNIRKLLNERMNGLNSCELEELIRKLKQYNHNIGIQYKIAHIKEKVERIRIEEYRKTKKYEREKLSEKIGELRKQKYLEQLRLNDYHDTVLEKLNVEKTLIYEIEKLKKKEIEVLKKEGYKKTNEYDPIESKNKNFLVKQILNHSPSHTFLVTRIKQLLEKYISPSKIRTHDTKDADLTFEVKYKIYAFEIETGTLLSKKKQLEKKVSLLNNKYGQNWYFVVSNRDLAKKYRKYGKVTSRMGVCKIIEKLVKN